MHRIQFIILLVCTMFHFSSKACTIVAVSGSVTNDGRPLLLKHRDSNWPNVRMKISQGSRYLYLCQCNVPDSYALSGYNEVGFAIINSQSSNMPNSDASSNTYIMQLALERCATVEEFQYLLDSLPKPINVAVNYGVMDSLGNVAIFEVNAYTYTKYNVDSAEHGYMVRSNHSFSQDTTNLYIEHPTSYHRYLIASSYLESIYNTYGYFTKENLFGLTHCLTNSSGEDLRDIAPFDETTPRPVPFRFYVPRKKSDSGIIIQGLLPNENPNLTVAWTMVGPPLTTVTIPFWMTPSRTIPQKSKPGTNGHSWLSHHGLVLRDGMFVNETTIDLSKLYNLSETGNLQKICRIEEEILRLGNDLMNQMRLTGLSNNDIATYYSWVDNYLEEQYSINFYGGSPTNTFDNFDNDVPITEYYDLLGRRVYNVPANAVLKRSGNKAIILN